MNDDQRKSMENENNYDEEYATEIAPNRIDNTDDTTSGGVIAGFIGVGAALIALFMMPVTLGIVGIVLGAYASAKGARGLGMTAIVVGIIAAGAALLYRAALITLFFAMF